MSEVEKNRGISEDAIASATSDVSPLTKAQLQAELERKEQELRELEETVKQLFKNIPLPMHLMYVDKEHRIRYVSEELAKYRGFESAEQVIGLETSELFPGKGGKTINAVIDTGKPIDHAEMKLGKKVEEEEVKMPILASCRPIYDAGGEVVGAVPAFTEITEQKEKEKALQEQQEYLQKNTEKINEAMSKIAGGNLDITLEKEKSDEIGEIIDNVHAIAESVNGLVEEAKMLTDAASEGKLDIRGDVEKFKGAFAEIIQGINSTLDAVVEPVEEIDEFMKRMAVNDFTTALTGDYKGRFEKLKKNINNTLVGLTHLQDALNKIAAGDLSDLESYRKAGKFSKNDELTPAFTSMMGAVSDMASEIGMLTEATLEGKLDVRGDVTKFKGDYAKVVQGINDTLDAVIGPLNVAAEYVDRISKGDIPEEITDEYRGDFNEIKNNLNKCIDGLGGLVESNAVLQRMSVNDYTQRVEGSYQGIFAEVANATNGVQDRLLRMQEVVQNIAAGNLTALEDLKQVGNGAGRRSENDNLVPSFIRMMESIKGLVAEMEILTEATVEGKLDTRGDVSKFKSDYAKVVQGINDILDTIVEPVREVMRVCNALAEGNLSERIKIEAKGEFMELTEALNNFGDELQTIIADISKVAQNMAAGDLSADFTAETPGEFNAIRENINQANASLSDLIGELQNTVQSVSSIGKEAVSSVEQVNSGMQQISSASQQIAKGAQETSGTVNESAKEIKDTNAVLQQVQSHAEESNKFAVESAESAKETNEAAEKSAEGMKEIQEAIGDAVEVIKNLGSSLKQVGKATDMIEGIADQTNLLALNAAIEAARAGEHGRGFAVVAEEVRKLAENSKQSTAEIDSMIKTLQEEMDKVTKATETITQRAEVGREDLDKVVGSVEKTAGMIDDIKGRMEQITEGARKGAESVEKVSKGVDEIASSAEESASSSEEASSAVEEQTAAIEQLSGGMQKLSEISDQATEMIGKFKLKENGGKKQE